MIARPQGEQSYLTPSRLAPWRRQPRVSLICSAPAMPSSWARSPAASHVEPRNDARVALAVPLMRWTPGPLPAAQSPCHRPKPCCGCWPSAPSSAVSYTHLRAHETSAHL
eukprot:2070154-Alexandrium_andersonii.AAC.1